MELGMIHRGEASEITTVTGGTVDSELSGNMIDLCPVGALTSKPFRYSARTWELSRRKSVSPHDSVGANLVVQVKAGTVMRVVPFENEEVNECWISDRDRFSYEALNGERRLTRPMIKQGGAWQEVDWSSALAYVADGLKRVKAEFGTAAIGALGHPTSTVEELHLLAKLVRGFGSESIDHRLRHADFANAAAAGRARWLGASIASLSQVDRAFVIGSFLRKDHPLLALRLRQAVRRGAQLSSLHALHDDWAMPVANVLTAAPSSWAAALAEVAAAVAAAQDVEAPVRCMPGPQAQAIAASLLGGQRKAVLLGNAAAQHPQAGPLLHLANWIAERVGASSGYLGESGNSVGAQLVGALPGAGGLNAGQMLGQPMKALLLFNVEPVLDAADAAAVRRSLTGSGLVVGFTPFKDTVADVADVMLPIAPFTETGGSFVNAEGRLQSFHGVARPLGDTRPGWKVLRVLGNLLDVPGFDFETVEDVRSEALGDPATLSARLDNGSDAPLAPATAGAPGSAAVCERIADVPIHASDACVRRAPSLQLTADARPPVVGVPSALWAALRLTDKVLVHMGDATVLMPAREDATLAEGAVRIAAGHPSTAALGAMFGTVTLEKV
jgi:NADH-quinone oxidoreductase subunit G